MTVIRILPHPEYCPQGAQVEAPAGTSICEALLDNGIRIEHACDMAERRFRIAVGNAAPFS